jgi:hypothetical protein
MKHVFVVETVDEAYLAPSVIDSLRHDLMALVERAIAPHEASVQCACNRASAIRAVYSLFAAEQSKSPDELGSAL